MNKKVILWIGLAVLVIAGVISWLMYAGAVANPWKKELPPPPQSKEEFLQYIMTAPAPASSLEAKKQFLEQISKNSPPTPEDIKRSEDQKREFIESLSKSQ